MTPNRELPASVHLLPALVPPGSLADGVVVVIDALRATSAMVRALDSGAVGVWTFVEVDDARAAHASLPEGSAFLGGERGGAAIPGFDVGNSPRDYTPELCAGRTLIMTTTNGTKALAAATDGGAGRVFIGAFTNRAATARAAASSGRPVHLICAGTEGFVSLEDALCAGAILRTMLACEPAVVMANDPAWLALGAWEDAHRTGQVALATRLRQGRGGKNVARLGLDRDIEDVARLDSLDLAAALDPATGRIVRIDL